MRRGGTFGECTQGKLEYAMGCARGPCTLDGAGAGMTIGRSSKLKVHVQTARSTEPKLNTLLIYKTTYRAQPSIQNRRIPTDRIAFSGYCWESISTMADTAAEHGSLITQFCSLTGVAPHEVSFLPLQYPPTVPAQALARANVLPQAQQYLATNQWDLSSAAAEYYTSLEEGAAEDPGEAPRGMSDVDDDQHPIAVAAGGGRTLGATSGPQPIPTTSSVPPPPSSSSRQAPPKKFATLGDISGGGASGHAGHGDDDDEDDDESEKRDLFAGGEKSALAVQNPNKQSAADLQRKILERARK